MELAPAIERLQKLAASKRGGLHAELAASFLQRLGPDPAAAFAGLPIQRSEPVGRLPVYVRAPHRLPVGLVRRPPVDRMLALFAEDSQPLTEQAIARGTGLHTKNVGKILAGDGRFQRDGIDPLLWSVRKA